MVRVAAGGVAAIFVSALTTGARAQTSGAAPAQPSTRSQTTLSDVVIQSARPGVAHRIDSEIYDIRDDAQAKAAPLILSLIHI